MVKDMIISVQEYEKIKIGPVRNQNNKQISKDDANKLMRLIFDEHQIFEYRLHSLVPQQYIGCIDLGDLTIEILPKIADRFDNLNSLREIAFRMIIRSMIPYAANNLPGRVNLTDFPLSEMIINSFLQELSIYIQSGLYRTYNKVFKETSTIKGKIDIKKQVAKNTLSTKISCIYKKYDENNDLNSFFLCCIGRILSSSKQKENLNLANKLKREFLGVKQMNLPQAMEYELITNSLNEYAASAFRLGKLILTNYGYDLLAGSEQAKTMLFDMNRIFEKFVFESLRKKIGNKILFQNNSGYLLEGQSRNYALLRPDITIRNWPEKGQKIIIDTKWKTPKKFASIADIYQLNAYSGSIKDVKDVYLFFPRSANSPLTGDYHYKDNSGTNRPLKIRTVDLSSLPCANWNSFCEYITSLLN